jgi:hypothetical protein
MSFYILPIVCLGRTTRSDASLIKLPHLSLVMVFPSLTIIYEYFGWHVWKINDVICVFLWLITAPINHIAISISHYTTKWCIETFGITKISYIITFRQSIFFVILSHFFFFSKFNRTYSTKCTDWNLYHSIHQNNVHSVQLIRDHPLLPIFFVDLFFLSPMNQTCNKPKAAKIIILLKYQIKTFNDQIII